MRLDARLRQASSHPPSQCDSDEAVTPGESVSDDVSDALAAHMDVTEIQHVPFGGDPDGRVSLPGRSGDTDIRPNCVPENVVEYSWEVSVDVDGDRETGFEGFEYILSSIYVAPRFQRRDRRAAITADELQTNTWHLKSAGEAFPEFDFLGWARIEVSAEEDTVTLSGEIPGITAESQLAFGVYDYLGGSEEVGCLTPFGLGRPAPFQGPSDGSAALSGRSVSGDVSHELVGHIDIRGVTTALDGETLTVTLLLRDVPETLTFDRTGVPEHALEYSWEVSIDVDNDPETGAGGFDSMLSADYFVSSPCQRQQYGGAVNAAGLRRGPASWGLDREGNRVHAEGRYRGVCRGEQDNAFGGDPAGSRGNHRSSSRRMISLKVRSR